VSRVYNVYFFILNMRIRFERTPLQCASSFYPALDSSLDYFCDKFLIQRPPSKYELIIHNLNIIDILVNISIAFKGINIEVHHSELTSKLESVRRTRYVQPVSLPFSHLIIIDL